MKTVDRMFSPIVIGILISLVGPAAHGTPTDHRPVGAAVVAGNSGGQGVSGRPQKNGTIKGSPKANPSINGSQTRGKH